MRVAIVHDWLYVVGGAERVLQGMLRCFPDADVHCLFDFLSQEDRRWIGYETSKTSFLQRMPGIQRRHMLYLPIMPIAIEQLDLRKYDVIISSSSAVAKGVIAGPNQLHVSYVHSPMRYAWDLQQTYLEEARLVRGVRSLLARILLHFMRIWDVRTSNGVDAYIANSRFVARRIQKAYRREAEVIYPPVSVPLTLPSVVKKRFFLTASRLVHYKNMRPIVEAFKELPNEQLIIVGVGPQLQELKDIAPSNVRFLGFVDNDELHELMSAARAFVFAAEEDFGIVAVEAQAHGTPVIALGRGGARETVMVDEPSPTGLFFAEPRADLIAAAMHQFIRDENRYSRVSCHQNAWRFSQECFDSAFKEFVENRWAAYGDKIAGPTRSGPHSRVVAEMQSPVSAIL